MLRAILLIAPVVKFWWLILAVLAVAVVDCLVCCVVMHQDVEAERTRRARRSGGPS
jgi:hypothetical protein